MCEKCRIIFGANCEGFLASQLQQFDDPIEVIEAFVVQSVGSVYARLAQEGITEAHAKAIHDKVVATIADMNTKAMRDRALAGDKFIPASALLN